MKYYESERQKKIMSSSQDGDDGDDGDDENKVQNNVVRRTLNLLNSALLSDEQLASHMLSRRTDDSIRHVVQRDKLIMRFSSLREESQAYTEDHKQPDVHNQPRFKNSCSFSDGM